MSQKPNVPPTDKSQWAEIIEVAGNELVDRVKDLVEEGNVRRLIIRNANNDVLIEVPLTPAVVVGGVATVWNPILAALGTLAAALAKIKIEVVRVEDIDENAETIEIPSDDVKNKNS